jgi:hypothetical protein
VRPVVLCDQGVLLGAVGDIHVLSDPDVIANHGLLRGENAAFVVDTLRHLAHSGAIVFDETLHGHEIQPSIWHVMGEFPNVLVPVHLLLTMALVLWVAHGRFGPVLPAPAALGAGKEFLIRNVAALLHRGGHHGPSLRRYGRMRVRDAVEALHAPRGLSDAQCREWLLARMRDAESRDELEVLLARSASDTQAREVVATARRIRSLTREVLHAGQ